MGQDYQTRRFLPCIGQELGGALFLYKPVHLSNSTASFAIVKNIVRYFGSFFLKVFL